MNLLFQDVSSHLHSFTLNVNLVLSGQLTVLFGASGSGKTTLLELISGLRKPDHGSIVLNKTVLSDTQAGTWLPPQKRGIGYVPQDLALFPHLNTRQNLAYGLQNLPTNPRQGMDWNSVVSLLELTNLLNQPVSRLSGGERQRVAFGRALLSQPQLLLLDEPLSNLDLPLKRRILPYLTRIRDHFQIPMIYVTHDRYETIALGDQMCVIHAGQIVQHGTVQEVFRTPSHLEVAQLLAVETLLRGTILQVQDGMARVNASGLEFLAALNSEGQGPDFQAGAEVHVCIRAEDVVLSRHTDHASSARNRFEGEVVALSREGHLYRVELRCSPSAFVSAWLTGHAVDDLQIQTGHRFTAHIKAQHIHLIPLSPPILRDGPR